MRLTLNVLLDAVNVVPVCCDFQWAVAVFLYRLHQMHSVRSTEPNVTWILNIAVCLAVYSCLQNQRCNHSHKISLARVLSPHRNNRRQWWAVRWGALTQLDGGGQFSRKSPVDNSVISASCCVTVIFTFCSSPAPPHRWLPGTCYTDIKRTQFSFICKARFTEHTVPKQLYNENCPTFAFRDSSELYRTWCFSNGGRGRKHLLKVKWCCDDSPWIVLKESTVHCCMVVCIFISYKRSYKNECLVKQNHHEDVFN